MPYERPQRRITRRDLIIATLLVVVGALGWLRYEYVHTVYLSRFGAAYNNLQQLGNAAQSYMMEKDRTQAAYTDLVGTGTNNYLPAITPVVDENYTSLVIVNGQSQRTLSSAYFGTVTYNM